MARSRKEKTAIAFMTVWLIVWTAGIFIVVAAMVPAALGGDMGALAFMSLWIAGAGFGLYAGGRKLKQLLMTGKEPPAPARNHQWTDDVSQDPRDP
jgi:hypothetical protein